MQLSPDQESALEQIRAWVKTDEKTLTLGGYAGTGKSTLIQILVEEFKHLNISICAFTGKAASVLRALSIPACTMHSLIYQPEDWCELCQKIVQKISVKNQHLCSECMRPVKTRFIRVPFIDVDFVIVDEASMLNLNHVQDLEELVRKVLYVGDHGQLEPIGQDPGVMRNPQIRLEKIHRQAERSAIIQFAHHVRLQRSPASWSPKEVCGEQTTVVNLNLQEYDVYIGRSGHGHDGYFGNPFKLRERCKYCNMTHEWPTATIPCFRKYFEERVEKDDEFKKRVLQLAGKRLGCFCKPNMCHGDVIADYVNRQNATDNSVTLHSERPKASVLNQFDIVICGYNNTRVAVNSGIRKLRNFKDELPEVGERLICLQNDTDLGIFNGLLVTVKNRIETTRYNYPKYDLIDDAGREYFDVPINPDQLGREKKLDRNKKGLGVFDFGYCMTAHKCQGSQFDKVAVLEQIGSTWEKARWRYTAATRAAKQLDWWVPQ